MTALLSRPRHNLPGRGVIQPLSRDVIRRELDKLEALGFFARSRCSRGPRGGFMACSFRHPQRQDLIAAVQAWAAANAKFKAKTAAHRREDLQAFRQALPARAQHGGSATSSHE